MEKSVHIFLNHPKINPIIKFAMVSVLLGVITVLAVVCTTAATEAPPNDSNQGGVNTAVAQTLVAQPTNTPYILPTEVPLLTISNRIDILNKY